MRLPTKLKYQTEFQISSKLWKRLKLCDKYFLFKMYVDGTKHSLGRYFFHYFVVFFLDLWFNQELSVKIHKALATKKNNTHTHTLAQSNSSAGQVNFVCLLTSLYRSRVLITSSSSTNWNRNFVCESPFFHYIRPRYKTKPNETEQWNV